MINRPGGLLRAVADGHVYIQVCVQCRGLPVAERSPTAYDAGATAGAISGSGTERRAGSGLPLAD